METLECCLNSSHKGSVRQCLWIAGYRKHQNVARGYLCEACQRSVGAWFLPEQEQGETHVVPRGTESSQPQL